MTELVELIYGRPLQTNPIILSVIFPNNPKLEHNNQAAWNPFWKVEKIQIEGWYKILLQWKIGYIGLGITDEYFENLDWL